MVWSTRDGPFSKKKPIFKVHLGTIMLVFLPVIILSIAATAGILLVITKREGGFLWAISFISLLAIWISVLVIPISSYQPLQISSWFSIPQISSVVKFSGDLISISYVFCICSILFCFLIISIIHLQKQNWNKLIILNLIAGCLGFLSLISQDSLSLVLIWTLLDLYGLGLDLWFSEDNLEKQKAVVSLAIKIVGSLIVIGGGIKGVTLGIDLDLSTIPTRIGLIFLVGIICRFVGIIYNFPKMGEEFIFRSKFIFKVISLATVFSLLGRIPKLEIPAVNRFWILFVLIIMGVWSVLRILFSKNFAVALPSFFSGLTGIQFYCAIQGKPEATLVWGCLALLIGILLGMFQRISRSFSIIPSLGLLLAVGIPFTLGGIGLVGIIEPFSVFSVFILLILLGILADLARIVWQMPKEPIHLEKILSFVYGIGIVSLPLSGFILGIQISRESYPNPNFLYSTIMLVAWIVIGGMSYWLNTPVRYQRLIKKFHNLVQNVKKIRDWDIPRKISHPLFNLLENVIRFISRIMEGEGGFLWTLVLLALMISVVSLGGG
jgi:hypothetical protein